MLQSTYFTPDTAALADYLSGRSTPAGQLVDHAILHRLILIIPGSLLEALDTCQKPLADRRQKLITQPLATSKQIHFTRINRLQKDHGLGWTDACLLDVCLRRNHVPLSDRSWFKGIWRRLAQEKKLRYRGRQHAKRTHAKRTHFEGPIASRSA